jgi:hypothetical protein
MQFVSEYEITENGKLVSWEIFVFRETEMVLQVFREQSPLNYNLVGSTTFQATAGYNQVEADIDVQAGDVLGWYCDGVQAIEYSDGGEVRVRRKYGYTGVENQVDVMNHANGWFREYSIKAEITVSQSSTTTSATTTIATTVSATTEEGLACPAGWEQRGALGADIGGCGLQNCTDRYDAITITHCSGRCDNEAECKAFSFAPMGSDRNHADQVVCTLYKLDQPTSYWTGSDGTASQIFCARIMEPAALVTPICDSDPCPQCDTCATPICRVPTVIINDCDSKYGDATTPELTRYALSYIADIPVGAKNVNFTMTSSVDLDMHLRTMPNPEDPESDECLAGYSCTLSCWSRPQGCNRDFDGMNVFFSGDDTSNPVTETITVDYVSRPLILYVRGYATGSASVTYHWDGVDPCTADISAASHRHCECPPDHYFVEGEGCMSTAEAIVELNSPNRTNNVISSTATPVNTTGCSMYGPSGTYTCGPTCMDPCIPDSDATMTSTYTPMSSTYNPATSTYTPASTVAPATSTYYTPASTAAPATSTYYTPASTAAPATTSYYTPASTAAPATTTYYTPASTAAPATSTYYTPASTAAPATTTYTPASTAAPATTTYYTSSSTAAPAPTNYPPASTAAPATTTYYTPASTAAPATTTYTPASTAAPATQNPPASTNRFTHQSVGVWSPGQAPQGPRVDVFDTYDEDLNGNLTLSDLTLMTQHMHIWDSILGVNATSSNLTQPEIDAHIETYNGLWDGIVGVIKALDRTDNGVVDDHDISMINAELSLARDKLEEWERGFRVAASALDQSHDAWNQTEVSITFDDLDARANNSKQEFKDRIETAFERLDGNGDNTVTDMELQHNHQRIALLLAAFHDLHEMGHDHISKTTYTNMLAQIENDVNSLEDQIADARSRIANGRRLYEAATYEAEL